MHSPSEERFETRWPTDGDRLFVESDFSSEAPLVTDPGERFYRLPMGYKRAGDILLKQIAVDVMDNRNVIYSALYCYRHSIELFMKQILERFGVTPTRNTHDLKVLWERFMTLAKDRGAENTIGLNAARELVSEMHEADRKSDGFRFPTDRADTPFLFADRGVDLANLMVVMQSLANFFECCHLEFENHGAIL